MRILPTLAILVFAILITSSVNAQNTYTHTLYGSDGSNPATVLTPSFKSDKTNCYANINFKVDSNVSTGSYTLLTSLYSPNDVVISSSERELSSNHTCLDMGTSSSNTFLNNYLESKAILTRSGGDSSTGYLITNYTCTFSDTDYINITTEGVDSRYYVPNLYYKTACNSVFTSQYFLEGLLDDDCPSIPDSWLHYEYEQQTCGGSTHLEQSFWEFPFKTGESGIIYYQVDNLPSFTASQDFGIYEMDDSSTFVDLGTTYEDDLTLKANTNYVLHLEGRTNGANNTAPLFNVSINAYAPNWIISDWSDCIDGQQYQEYDDPLDKIPNRIVYRSCIDYPIAEVNLGFETGYTPAILPEICVPKLYPACDLFGLDDIEVPEVLYPENWNVYNPLDNYFLDIVDTESSHEQRSLKMWYLPPMIRYDLDGDDCEYLKEGSYPSIYQGVNDSLFVSYNVSFPAPYMSVLFDIKQCQEPVVQYDGWCGKACYGYAGNCTSDSIKGFYLNRLVDTTTSEIIYNYYDDAPAEWTTQYIDLSDYDLTNRTYNLVFAVNPEKVSDAYGHCVYIDNVRLAVLDSPISCETYCDGLTRYEATFINESYCVFEIIENSPYCLDSDNREKALNYEDYCINTTLYTYDNETKEWESFENDTYCVEQEAEESIYDPLGIADPYISYMDSVGLGVFGVIFAPMFISLIVAVVVAFLLISKLSLDDIGGAVIFMVIFFGFLGGFSILGLFPIWFLIVMILLSGGIAGFLITRT